MRKAAKGEWAFDKNETLLPLLRSFQMIDLDLPKNEICRLVIFLENHLLPRETDPNTPKLNRGVGVPRIITSIRLLPYPCQAGFIYLKLSV